ncbi:MAG TPA: DUF1707 and DUF4190 domain-containing protein [Pseudonocardiaceae bacterium]|nr:DUF1707 and DUF4190 domain-containing protein [Pseudonocardiaceae bacterium]
MTDPERGMRISDEERRAAAERLRVAQSEGRLTVSDYDNRLGRLYEAQTYSDLNVLFADLPMPQPMQQMQMQPMQPMQQGFPPQQQNWPGGFQQQPSVGPISGPAAVVHNTIVTQAAPVMLANSGAATAGMVLGILGLIGFWIPFGDILFSGLAVLFSIIGLSQTSGNVLAGRGRAIAGLICGIIGLIPAIIVVILLATAATFI